MANLTPPPTTQHSSSTPSFGQPTTTATAAITSPRLPIRVLTVGDGDLTFSLALARCYSPLQLQVTASTLVSSREELCQTYHNCHEVLLELEQRQVQVLYNVDATKLDRLMLQKQQQQQQQQQLLLWDAILFQHPHLGLSKKQTAAFADESYQAQRHYVLLAHYLASAKACVVQPGGVVHVCLCGTQATTWSLEQAASRQGWLLLERHATEVPIHIWKCWSNTTIDDNHNHSENVVPETNDEVEAVSSSSSSPGWLVSLPPQRNFAAPRRYRNGRYGSRHFLGKYGYRHRRTHGDIFTGTSADMNVIGSVHYIFTLPNDEDNNNNNINMNSNSNNNKPENGFVTASDTLTNDDAFCCHICNMRFDNEETLRQHLQAPALPDPPSVAEEEDDNEKTTTTTTNNENIRGVEEHLATKAITSTPKGLPRDPSFPNGIGTIVLEQKAVMHQNYHPNDCAYSFTISKECDGARLDQFLHLHIVTVGGRLSKKQAKRMVDAGQVWINDKLVHDKSRILHTNDHIAVMKEAYVIPITDDQQLLQSSDHQLPPPPVLPPTSLQQQQQTIEIVHEADDFIVVMKPRSMRAIGDFTPHTLERTFSSQQGVVYRCLTRMDSGCPGLCVMQRKEAVPSSTAAEIINTGLTHVYTVLVHGHVPDEWCDPTGGINAMLPSNRWWKNQRNKFAEMAKGNPTEDTAVAVAALSDEDSDTPRQNDVDATDPELSSPMKIVCIERTKQKDSTEATTTTTTTTVPALSTLTIATSCTSGGPCRRICSHLRLLGFPVVNDRKHQRNIYHYLGLFETALNESCV